MSFADFVQNQRIQKIISGTLSECQTVLDADQDRRFVGPDLGPKLFANVINRRQKLWLARKGLNFII